MPDHQDFTETVIMFSRDTFDKALTYGITFEVLGPLSWLERKIYDFEIFNETLIPINGVQYDLLIGFKRKYQ